MDLKGKRILICGGHGLLGTALQNKLRDNGINDIHIPYKKIFNYLNEEHVYEMYHDIKPDIVFNLSVKFGGIVGNSKHPGDFFYSNMLMGLNLIHYAKEYGVKKFIQIGSQCSYSSNTKVPFKETDLWNGYPEKNNAAYGIAKRALSEMVKGYREEFNFPGIYLIPCNMYGPEDNFHPVASHVVPGLIRKFVEAKEQNKEFVELWGTGNATRELLFVEDAAEALILATERLDDSSPVNIGSGLEIKIFGLAKIIKELVGYKGEIVFNNNGLDGQMRRCNDNTKAKEKFGFEAKTSLENGLKITIDWFLNNRNNIRELVYE